MKSTRYILVDHSTKGPGTSKWGKSAACWALFYRLDRMPYEVGLLYSHNERTNRMFFRGVLAGLEYCIDNDKENSCDYGLVVKGDCECVINVLNGKTGRYKLSRFYDIAKHLEERLKTEKQVDVRYEYIPRNEKIYQSIDQCAKRGRAFIESQLGIK